MHRGLLPILLIALFGLHPAKADESKVQLMFVQTADSLRVDGATLRLVGVGRQTLYFSDRPARIAGGPANPSALGLSEAKGIPGRPERIGL